MQYHLVLLALANNDASLGEYLFLLAFIAIVYWLTEKYGIK